MSNGKTTLIIVRALTVMMILGVGVGTFATLKSMRKKPEKKGRTQHAFLVDAIPLHTTTATLMIDAQGTVIPAQQVIVSAEVTGRVTWQNPALIPGGLLPRGALLARVDDRDYRLAMSGQSAQVERAVVELEVEQSRKRVADREWQLLGKEGDASALAQRLPQLRAARNSVVAAESSLERSRILLSKTALRAPFNAVVRTESVDIGQLVGPQSPIATLVGTDAFWVQVAVPVSQLEYISIPGINANEGEGSPARIVQELGEKRIEREGQVIRLLGELDPSGQMARLLIEIADPFGLTRNENVAAPGTDVPADAGKSRLPLLLSAYVRVHIAAGTMEDVVEVPRAAVRNGDTLYVMTAERTLDIRRIPIVWRRADSIYTSQKLGAGERLITSRVPTAIQGMRLRALGDDTVSEEKAGSDEPGPT